MEQLEFDSFHGLIKSHDFLNSRQNSISPTTVASWMENKRKVMEKLAEISLSYISLQKIFSIIK
jgi:hypothetical protein